MVTNITSLTGNGLKDWLIQRMTAVYLAGYVIFLGLFFLNHSPMNFTDWHGLFQAPMVKVATIGALLTLVLHAWIGLWTVTTDYIKCTVLRITVQMLILAALFGQFVWGLMIVWGQ